MKKSIKYILLVLLLVIVYIGFTQYPKFVLISGGSAKWVASGMFVAERTQNSVEVADTNFSPMNWASNEVDLNTKSVTSKVFGLQKRTAVYREGLGTVITNESYDPSAPYLVPKRNKTPKNVPFPYGNLPQKDTIFSNVNYTKLKNFVEDYFAENNEQSITRSLMVIYKNKIIAEKYDEGFDENSILLGWSMGKSLLSTVLGAMDQQGKINRNEANLIEAWKNDERSNITINNLLQMNSGLEWDEDYTTISDVTKMLFFETDMTKSQIDKPLVGNPNETWNYSSGTTNLLSGIMRDKFDTHQEYLDFWYTDLIDKIGMHSMLMETDLAGNYVASSYPWANTRDWAKYGLLYLNNGNWNGEQIISEDWVNYTKTPTNSSEGVYGAQFWLNAGGHMPDVPKDMYMADGYQGQRVFIIPSKELVVVRMGVNYSILKEQLKDREIKPEENQDVVEFELNNIASNKLLKEIMSAIN